MSGSRKKEVNSVKIIICVGSEFPEKSDCREMIELSHMVRSTGVKDAQFLSKWHKTSLYVVLILN